MKYKNPRTKAEILADPRVEEMWYEGEDGWWIALKRPWETSLETTCIHEYTIKECCEQMKCIRRMSEEEYDKYH